MRGDSVRMVTEALARAWLCSSEPRAGAISPEPEGVERKAAARPPTHEAHALVYLLSLVPRAFRALPRAGLCRCAAFRRWSSCQEQLGLPLPFGEALAGSATCSRVELALSVARGRTRARGQLTHSARLPRSPRFQSARVPRGPDGRRSLCLAFLERTFNLLVERAEHDERSPAVRRRTTPRLRSARHTSSTTMTLGPIASRLPCRVRRASVA